MACGGMMMMLGGCLSSFTSSLGNYGCIVPEALIADPSSAESED